MLLQTILDKLNIHMILQNILEKINLHVLLQNVLEKTNIHLLLQNIPKGINIHNKYTYIQGDVVSHKTRHCLFLQMKNLFYSQELCCQYPWAQFLMIHPTQHLH